MNKAAKLATFAVCVTLAFPVIAFVGASLSSTAPQAATSNNAPQDFTTPTDVPTDVPATPDYAATSAALVRVSALTMARQYDANKIAAQSYYTGREVRLSGGIITDINQDIMGDYYVAVAPPADSYSGFASMQCYVAGSYSVSRLYKGAHVQLLGTVGDMTLGIVPFKPCVAVSFAGA